MDKALWESATSQKRIGRKLDWRKKMSDNVAYALLVYTGLQIFVTMGQLNNGSGSILPCGIGREAVRAMRTSTSASYHMFSAPAAPAPMAIARMAIMASSGLTVTGAAKRPTKAVNTTSDITRGFKSAK